MAAYGFILGSNEVSGRAPFFVQTVPTSSQVSVSTDFSTANEASYDSLAPCFFGMTCKNVTNGQLFNRNGSTSAMKTPAGAAATILTEVSLFKAKDAGNTGYAGGKTNFSFFGYGMSQSQLQSLELASIELLTVCGRLPSLGGVAIFDGDSITIGVGATTKPNTYASQLSRKLGLRELNISQGSTLLSSALNNDKVPGYLRDADLDKLPATTIIRNWLTNDSLIRDATTNGDATIIADCKAKYTTMNQHAIALNLRVLICGIGYCTSVTLIKCRAYNTAIAEMCRTLNIPFFNWLEVMLDYDNITVSGSASSLLADFVHPNNLGHKLLADGLNALAQGRYSRIPTMGFPSIAADSSADLTFLMSGANINTSVELGLPTTNNADISFTAFVSATDIVTVRAYNNSASAIALAAFKMKITIFLDLAN